MGNGLVNVRDQKFVLFEQIGIDKLFKSGKYGDYTLDDANMINMVTSLKDDGSLHESRTMIWSETQQKTLYGYFNHHNPDNYWDKIDPTEPINQAGKSTADIYGYIDGGMNPGERYQHCCTSQPWKGEALAMHLMPEMKVLWEVKFFDYVDRWVNFGTWPQPDPCAPHDQGGGHDYNTDFCIILHGKVN